MKYLVKTKGIFDGTGSAIQEGAAFVVHDGKIEEIGYKLSADELVDLSAYYVLPGLIDSHTHLSIVPGEGNQLGQMALPCGRNVIRSLPNIRAQLESGVTSMRIMGEENDLDFEIRRGIEEGYLAGPRLVISGTPITATNGHGATITVSDGEPEVRKNIRKNFRKGADFVKIFMTGGMSSTRPPVDFCGFSKQELAAIVDEAKRMHTYVAAHAHGGSGVDACIEAGVLSIEHGALVSDEQLRRMKDAGMYVVSTTSILYHPDGLEKTDFSNPVIKAKVLANRAVSAETHNRIVNSGVKYACGTDSMHGLMYFEVANLVKFGASPADALFAATKRGSELLMMEDKIGTLEKGKYADFIAVEGNPLENIENLKKVKLVYKGGALAVDRR